MDTLADLLDALVGAVVWTVILAVLAYGLLVLVAVLAGY